MNFELSTRRRLAPFAAGLLVTMCTLFSPVIEAGMYKWVDADGSVSYSDRPPTDPGITEVQGLKTSTVAESLKKQEEDEERQRQDDKLKQQAAIQNALAPDEPEQTGQPDTVESDYSCSEAKNLYKFYNSTAQDLFQTGEDGSSRLLTDDERVSLVSQWKRAEELLCRDEPAAQEASSTQ